MMMIIVICIFERLATSSIFNTLDQLAVIAEVVVVVVVDDGDGQMTTTDSTAFTNCDAEM